MSFLPRLLRLLRTLLRELSDESAYARHLQAHGLAASAQEWRRFSDGRYRRKFANAKCC